MTSRRMKAVRALAALGENAIVDRLLGKPDRADRGLRVLAIDGGGMKGLVVCVLLRELERRTGRRYAPPRTGRAGPLARAWERLPGADNGDGGRRLHELFDLIGGTSTGGYMACGAGIFKVRALFGSSDPTRPGTDLENLPLAPSNHRNLESISTRWTRWSGSTGTWAARSLPSPSTATRASPATPATASAPSTPAPSR